MDLILIQMQALKQDKQDDFFFTKKNSITLASILTSENTEREREDRPQFEQEREFNFQPEREQEREPEYPFEDFNYGP
jgi:hypothetical protein